MLRNPQLQILFDLTDRDLEVLAAHQGLGWQQYFMKHFYLEPMAYGPYRQLSDEERNAYDARKVAWDMHVATLVRFGLLAAEVNAIGPRRTDFEIDERTGLPKVVGHRITALGELLLRRTMIDSDASGTSEKEG